MKAFLLVSPGTKLTKGRPPFSLVFLLITSDAFSGYHTRKHRPPVGKFDESICPGAWSLNDQDKLLRESCGSLKDFSRTKRMSGIVALEWGASQNETNFGSQPF